VVEGLWKAVVLVVGEDSVCFQGAGRLGVYLV
jgi:hypothetical protein